MAKVATLGELIARMPRTEPRYALLLGAGASISSGIPAASTLIAGWKRLVFLDLLGEERMSPAHLPLYQVWLSPKVPAEISKATLIRMEQEEENKEKEREKARGAISRTTLRKEKVEIEAPDESDKPVEEKLPLKEAREALGDHRIPSFSAWYSRTMELERHPSDYSLLFSRAVPDEDARQGFIEDLCAGAEPCAGYVYLATLVRDNFFRTILTTNFDDLIHDAIYRYAAMKPVVCAFDSQVSTVRLVGPRPKIIKLHGDFLYSGLKNVSTEVARLDVNMRQKFEQTCINYGLIVIGYSGGDQSVMDPIRSMLTQPGYLRHGLHWGIHVPNDVIAKADGNADVEIPEEVARLRSAYPDRVHLYAVGQFDHLMGALARSCRCDPPLDLTHPEERSSYARLRDAITNAEQNWRLEPQFRRLLTSFRTAQLRQAHAAPAELDRADELHLQASAMKRKAAKAPKGPSQRQLYSAAADAFLKVARICDAVQKGEAATSSGTPRNPARAAEQDERAWRPEFSIWLRRRRGGVLSGAAEALYYAWAGGDAPRDQVRDMKEWRTFAKREQFLAFSHQTLQDSIEGWQIAKDEGFPSAVAGHTRNFAFNGLLGIAYLMHGGERVSSSIQDIAVRWVEELLSDRAFGDAYLKEIGTDIGGEALLRETVHWGTDTLLFRQTRDLGRSKEMATRTLGIPPLSREKPTPSARAARRATRKSP